MWQLQLLAALTAAAEQRSVRVLALKGVALSLHLYGDPFIRESFDLDLLVHPDDSGRFEEIILAQGCAALTHGPALTQRQMAILQRYHHDKQFNHAESGAMVESHHLLDRNPYLIGTDFDALWRTRAQVRLASGGVAILGSDDLVHQLGVHASRRGWGRWKWIADLVAFFRGASDADLLRQRDKARGEGNETMFDSWLLLTRAVTGMALPQAALERAARNERACLLSERALHLSVGRRTPSTFLGQHIQLREVVFRLGLKRSARYVAFELTALFHRDEDWYSMRLPNRLIWLYYPAWLFGYGKRRVKSLFLSDPIEKGPAA